MQYFSEGYRPGDPRIRPAAEGRGAEQGPLPAEVDVLIVGSGPAGLLLAAQLSQFPEIVTRVVEKAPGPLQVGRADGVNCRTVEMFEAFGLADKMIDEAYWVNETHFWGADPQDNSRITRLGRTQDVRDLLSEYPHVIVNQARLLDFLLEVMRNSPSRLKVDYGLEAVKAEVPKAADDPVTVTLRRSGAGTGNGDADEVTVRAKYVVGCRRRAQRDPGVHRPQDGAPGRGQGLGRDGPAGRHRLPRHPVQVHHPGRQRQEHPAHPPRGRAPVPALRRRG